MSCQVATVTVYQVNEYKNIFKKTDFLVWIKIPFRWQEISFAVTDSRLSAASNTNDDALGEKASNPNTW